MAQERSFGCHGCGYKGSTIIGGGFRNHLTHSPFPALCRACGEVRSVNEAKGATPGCMSCGSSQVTRFGTETREPAQNEVLGKAAERKNCRERIRVKVILRRAVRKGELTQEQADKEEKESDYLFPSLVPPWHEGDHLCPRCGTYGLRFSDVTMFLD